MEETHKMESPRQTAEVLVLLYRADNLAAGLLGVEYREDRRLHAIEHTRVDIVRCNGREMYILLHLVQLNTHRVAPAYHCPFARRIHRHLRVAYHARLRRDIADMPFVHVQHRLQRLQRKHHRRYRIHAKGQPHIRYRVVVEGLVAAHDTRAVDQHAHALKLLQHLFVGLHYQVVVHHVHLIGRYHTVLAQFLFGGCQRRGIYIPDNQVLSTFLEAYTPHNLSYPRSTAGDEDILTFNLCHTLKKQTTSLSDHFIVRPLTLLDRLHCWR